MSSTLTSQNILSIANLSRLSINPETAEQYAQDIGKILTMMDTLKNVNTDDIAPLTNVHDAVQVLRADVADTDIDRDANQSVAPSVQDGLYLVPQVIE